MGRTWKLKSAVLVLTVLTVAVLAAGNAHAWFSTEAGATVSGKTAMFALDYHLAFDEQDIQTATPGDEIASTGHSIENLGDIPMVVELKYEVVFDDASLTAPAGMFEIRWEGDCAQTGDAYYLRLEPGEGVRQLTPLALLMGGEAMAPGFLGQPFTVKATALASQVRRDAAESTFGSAKPPESWKTSGFSAMIPCEKR